MFWNLDVFMLPIEFIEFIKLYKFYLVDYFRSGYLIFGGLDVWERPRDARSSSEQEPCSNTILSPKICCFASSSNFRFL